MRYTSVIASDFLSQHPSLNHGLWEAKTFYYHHYYHYPFHHYFYYY